MACVACYLPLTLSLNALLLALVLQQGNVLKSCILLSRIAKKHSTELFASIRSFHVLEQ